MNKAFRDTPFLVMAKSYLEMIQLRSQAQISRSYLLTTYVWSMDFKMLIQGLQFSKQGLLCPIIGVLALQESNKS